MYTTDSFLKKALRQLGFQKFLSIYRAAHLVLLLLFNVFIYLKERERGRGKRERNINVVVSCMSPTGDRVCNPGNVP